MAGLVYLGAGVISSALRVYEKFLPINTDAERYLNHEISFKEATNGIVKNVHIYAPLTTVKLVCDVIVLSATVQWIYNVIIHVRIIFTRLIKCGFEAFQNGIKLSLQHFLLSLQTCSISLISNQFNYLYDERRNIMSSVSIINFCNICNHIYLIIASTTSGFTKDIQLELMKYWLECMGIIRAIAESHNINFVKYMNRCCSNELVVNQMPSLNNNHSFELKELQWERVKDPDFFQNIDVSLVDIYYGKKCDVVVHREIREIGKSTVQTEEARYTVEIEPGCVDGKIVYFNEAGHRDPVNIPGDLVVKIVTKKHQLYERNGSDLIYKAKISLNDALSGTPIRVPSIDGTMKECDPRGVINPNTTIVIDHAGLPDPTNRGIRGRLIVKFDIEFPDTKLGTEPTEQCINNN